MNSTKPQPGDKPQRPRAPYEPPQLKKHGSLAELTRSGTGTAMEAGMGPNTRFQ